MWYFSTNAPIKNSATAVIIQIPWHCMADGYEVLESMLEVRIYNYEGPLAYPQDIGVIPTKAQKVQLTMPLFKCSLVSILTTLIKVSLTAQYSVT